jgi:hypothetical protein
MNNKQHKRLRKLWSLLLAVTLMAAYLPFGQQKAEAADAAPAGSDKVVITSVTSAEGFTHPGIGLTKEILENARAQVIAKQEPWYSYYMTMSQSAYASSTFSANIFGSANADGTDNPKKRSVNSKGEFVADGLRAYTQALMYVFTGEESYRANAMRIIRLWSQMDPNQYSYFTDSHIHMGVPLNRMVTAAEILRYSGAPGEDPKWSWTEEDSAHFTTNLITPMIETFCHFNDKFMNQHLYPLLGAVAGYIFSDNTARYAEGVEWFTVNATAPDQGQNGAIKRLFRLVTHNEATGEPLETPRVQHVEMGRDQAHGAGDLTNAEILARMLEAQGTKVDPELGTLSTAGNAVTAYAFLGNRILAASDYFARFMLGHDTPWTPVIARYDNGVPIVYQILSGNYRGRIGGNVYGQYYYYKYNLGLDLEKEAPYYADMFRKRHMFWWESPDAGADYWLFIPEEAAGEGDSTLPRVSSSGLQEMEYRTATDLNGGEYASVGTDENGASYVRIQATEEGSRVSLVASGTALKTVALKVRTNGTARLELNGWKDNGIVLPDTKGQWQYAVLNMNEFQGLGDLIYLKATGNGTFVDIDHILLDAAAQLTPPAFAAGKSELNLYAYTGSQATLTYDFSAGDAGAGDRVRYQMDNKPEGALFDETTGAFSWKPVQPGSYSLVVSAGDGTSVMARSVSITVANDRQGAVTAAIAPYQPETHYISATLEAFQAEYAKSLQMLQTAADEEFYRQLFQLDSAVRGLQLLTPLMEDGSMDYVNMGVTSTFGSQIASLVDNAPDSFAGYYLTGDRSFIIDFGADFKVSADAVKLQVRAGFPERIGGAALYGSNDREGWIRLTPGHTVAADDMQELQVSAELRQNQYRFLRLHMNDAPTSTMFELSELRIIGTRHETHNKLASVSVTSPQAVQGRVSTGNTVSVSFTSTEPLTDVQVSIQGRQAAVISPDQRTWTAFMAMDSTMAMGKIRFAINYKTAAGTSADTVMFTTDNSSLYYINRSGFLDVSKLASVTASSAGYGSGGLPADKVGSLLFDGNPATFGDLASGSDAYYTVDFGEGSSVRLKGVVLMPRTGYAARMNGVVVKGSNDNAFWTELTPAVSGAADNAWTYISGEQIKDGSAYRYMRISNSGAWSGNIAEAELYGEYDIPDITSKVLGPEGYTRLSYYLYKQTADRIVDAFGQPGANKLGLLNELKEAEKLLVLSNTLPVESEKVVLAPDRVAASHKSWGSSTDNRAANGWRAFDGDPATYTDNESNPGWIDVDLGAGNEKALTSFKFYPRPGRAGKPANEYVSRVNGGVLQGSADGTTYINLHTISGASALDWYTVALSGGGPYRYLRYYSPSGGANVAELEFYYGASVDKTLLTYLMEKASELNVELYTDSSLLPFQTALEAANEVNNGSGYTQAKVDQTAAALLLAQGNLAYKEGVPLIAPIPDVAADAETRISFTVRTLNNMAGTLYAVNSLPAGASFNPSTGVFVWTPSKEQGGVYKLVLTATAGAYSTSDTVHITVKGAPQLEPASRAQLTARQPFTYQVTASDPTGQTLIYQALHLPQGATFNPANGTFSWTPQQTDYGSHMVTFVVSNTTSSATQTLSLEVGLHLFPAGDYTRGSYYGYQKEAARITAELPKPGANKQQLLAELMKAAESLVPNALSLYTFEGNLNNSFGAASATGAGSPEYVEGRHGQAVQLNGPDQQYLQLPQGHALAGYDEMTVAFWVNWSAGGQWQRIFDFGNGTTQYMFLTPQSGNNTLRFAVKNGGAEQAVNTEQLPLQQWVHVVVVLGGGNGRIFMNGVEKASAPVTIKPKDIKPGLNYIGKSQFAADPLFSGKLDELVIYNRALESQEINRLYEGNATWRDDSLLELLLAEAAALEPGDYTESTRTALQTAVSAGEQRLQSASSTQQQIDEAAGSLRLALEQLERLPFIESLKPVQIGTYVGIPPELPSVVDAVYNNKTVLPVPVVWNHLDPVLYSVPGSFSVSGAVYGTPLPAAAHVTVADPDGPLPAADQTPPSAPGGLTAMSVTASSLVLGWTPSTDNVGVTGYEVYRNGQSAGTVTSSTYSYTFTGLASDTAYTFKVAAFDAAGNRTASADFTARTNSSSGGSQGGWSGGAGNPSATGVEAAVDGVRITIKPAVKSGAAHAVLDAASLNKALAHAAEAREKRLLIDLAPEGHAASISLELPAEAWTKAFKQGIDVITVQTGLATLNIPVQSYAGLTGKGSLIFSLKTVPAPEWPAALHQALREKPVLEISFSADGKPLEAFASGGEIEVRIPYTLQTGESRHSLVAVSAGQQGRLEIVRQSRYEAGTGELVFAMKQPGIYGVAVFASTFKDMGDYGWAKDSVDALFARRIIDGISQGQFAPGTTVSRAEFLKMALEAFGLVQTGKAASFTDVGAGQWYSDPIASAQTLHIINGYEDGSFGPAQAVTREEMAVLVMRILQAADIELQHTKGGTKFQDDVQIAGYAVDAVNSLNEAGMIQGQDGGRFAPKSPTTRAEAAVLITRILGLE